MSIFEPRPMVLTPLCKEKLLPRSAPSMHASQPTTGSKPVSVCKKLCVFAGTENNAVLDVYLAGPGLDERRHDGIIIRISDWKNVILRNRLGGWDNIAMGGRRTVTPEMDFSNHLENGLRKQTQCKVTRKYMQNSGWMTLASAE